MTRTQKQLRARDPPHGTTEVGAVDGVGGELCRALPLEPDREFSRLASPGNGVGLGDAYLHGLSDQEVVNAAHLAPRLGRTTRRGHEEESNHGHARGDRGDGAEYDADLSEKATARRRLCVGRHDAYRDVVAAWTALCNRGAHVAYHACARRARVTRLAKEAARAALRWTGSAVRSDGERAFDGRGAGTATVLVDASAVGTAGGVAPRRGKYRARVVCAALIAVLVSGCSLSEPYRAVSGGDADRGAHAIERYGCGACHVIPGVRSAVGMVGPPLIWFGRRTVIAGEVANTPDELVTWIMDPQRIEPRTAMPNLGVSEQDARDIAAYLYRLH